jgi:short chain dehydrogenase
MFNSTPMSRPIVAGFRSMYPVLVARNTSFAPGSLLAGRRLFERSRSTQPIYPLAPVGVTAALAAAEDPSTIPRPTIFEEFSLANRVAIVSGGNRGLGLEMALALCEARARAVYCVDLPATPSVEWERTRAYVQCMGGGMRLEYISADVRDQRGIWDKVAQVGDREGRVDICVAAAGVLGPQKDCLEYPAEEFEEVEDSRADC